MLQSVTRIQGERALLRPSQEGDAEERRRVWTPELRYMYGGSRIAPRRPTGQPRPAVKPTADENEHQFAIEADGRYIGFVALRANDEEQSGRYRIGIENPDYWGKGYGTEVTRLMLRYAFETLNLHRVSLRVTAYNTRARRCYEKCGFRVEGVERESFLVDGEWQDDVLMAILREEWEKGERGVEATVKQHYQDQWSARFYEVQVAENIGDVPLWESLAEETGGPSLELACGTGRVLLELARRGHEVAGLDLSPHMLEVARQRLAQEPAEVQARVRLFEGNMTCFGIDARFRLIYIPARSFQALLTRGEQRACLGRCHQHLVTGGLLALDVFNTSLARLVKGSVQEGASEYQVPEGGLVRESGHSEYDLASQTLTWSARYECITGSETQVREYTTPLHYFFRYECEWMLEACGFEVKALYGSFDKSPYTAESSEMIFVARRG